MKVPFYQQRVDPAPMAEQRATTHASADGVGAVGRGLQRLGEGVSDLGRGIADVEAQRMKQQAEEQKKAHQKEAKDAYNAATLEAGDAWTAFSSKQGAAATDAEYTGFRKSVEEIYARHGQKLSAGASDMYRPIADQAVVAKKLDAGEHYQRQFNRQVEETNMATIALQQQVASQNPGSAQAVEAVALGVQTINGHPSWTPERKAKERLDFTTAVTAGAVQKMINEGRLREANAYYEGAKSGELVSGPSQIAIEDALRKAGQDAEDRGYAMQVADGVRKANPIKNEVPLSEIQLQQAEALKQVDEDKNLDEDARRRRKSLVRSSFSDELQATRARMDIHENERTKLVMSALDAHLRGEVPLTAVDEAIQKSDPWLQTTLAGRVQQVLSKVPGSAASAAPKELPAEEQDTFEANIWTLIREGQFKSRTVLENHIQILPKDRQTRLLELWDGKGYVKGLSPDKVMEEAAKIRGITDWKEKETELYPVYTFVRDYWPANKEPNPDTIKQAVAEYHWKVNFRSQPGMTGGFKQGYVGDALRAGDTNIEMILDPALEANAKAQLRAAGVNPDPTKTVVTPATKGFMGIGGGLPSPGYSRDPVMNALGAYGRPATSKEVSTEAFPNQRESDHYLTETYKRLGFLPADFIAGDKILSPAEARQKRIQRLGEQVKQTIEKGAKK